ncbi:TPA: hypothetical protein ACX6QR_002883 [Photobacterium damselae]
MTEKLVSFDLETDLTMSLECLSNAISRISNGNDYYLKWAVIYGHNSVQSAMCLALITSDSRLVRKRDSYDAEYGDLDSVEWLYEKLRKEEFLPYVNNLIFDSHRFQKQEVCRLQTVRNTFIHQHPCRYIFTFEELIELIDFSVNIVEFLVNESERLAITGDLKSQLEELLKKLSTQLTNV